MGRLVSDPAHLTGTMGETGVFLTRCWPHTDRDVSETFNQARVPSWFLTHTLPPALVSLGTEEPSGDLSPAASAATRLHVRAKKP